MPEDLTRLVSRHPFCEGMATDMIQLMAGCAENVKYPTGHSLFRHGEEAGSTYLVRSGRIGFYIPAPGRSDGPFETAEEGELVGWSWLFPPYRWHFDAVALTPVRVLRLDGTCLRNKCEADPTFGYEVTRRILLQAHKRLERSRMQALDLYGVHE